MGTTTGSVTDGVLPNPTHSASRAGGVGKHTAAHKVIDMNEGTTTTRKQTRAAATGETQDLDDRQQQARARQDEARAAKPPRTRRDAGRLRLGQRDAEGMKWCGQQYTVRIDHLAQLFSHLDRRVVSSDAARKTVQRWVAHGYANTAVLLRAEPAYVWLTTRGMSLAGLGYPAIEPTISVLRHTSAVNLIRLHLLERYPYCEWRSERAIRALLPPRTRGQQLPHVPDGELSVPGHGVIAIEAELTAKTIQRTRNIQLGLLSRKYDYDEPSDGSATDPRYRQLWYFVTDDSASVVRTAAAQLPADYQARMAITDVP